MANSEEYHDGDEVQLAPSNSSEGETLLALERFLDNISGWYQIVSLIGLCLADISASSLLFVIAFIKDELGVSDTLQGVISASVFVGMFFGGFYAGIIADNIGRKPCLMATMFINLFSGTLVALFPGSWIWILLCRFIAGVGIGGVLSSCFAMAAEIVGPKYRGPYIALLCTSSTIAGIYTAGSCWIILGQLNLHWIIACFATQLPNVPAILLAYFWICETPKYHFVNGEIDKSRLCLQHMSSKSRKEYIDIFSDIDMTQLQSPELTENEVVRKSTRQLVGMLFQDGLSPLTLALGATWFSMSFGWYGIILWIPSLFKEYGSTADIYEQAFMVPVAGLVGNIIITLSVSRFGGSLLLSTFMCFSFIVVGCMAFVDSLTAVVILACVYNAGSTAAWDALSCVSAEIYPTHIRGTAVGFMNAVEQVASGISQLAFGVAFSYSLSPFYILFPSACTMAAGAIAALFVHHKLKHKPTDTTEEALTQSNSEDQNIDPPIELRNSIDTSRAFPAMGRKKSASAGSGGLKKCSSFVSSSSGSAFGEFGIYNQVTCSICLEKYTTMNPAMTYQCGHAYHLQCAESWRQRNGTCPMCWEPLDEAALYTGSAHKSDSIIHRSDCSSDGEDHQSDSAPTKPSESASSHEPLVPMGISRTRSLCSMESDNNSSCSSDQRGVLKCLVGRFCRDCIPRLYTRLFNSHEH